MFERPTGAEPGIKSAVANYAQMAGAHCESVYLARNLLNGGELSPGMLARYDQPRYISGCESLLNMAPLPCGGITKRPGFAHMAFAAAREPGAFCRLTPFVFSASESRILEFYQAGGGVGLRVWLPDGGSVNTGLALPWRPQWLPDMSFCQSADIIYCAHAQMPPGKVQRFGDHDWRYEAINWLPSVATPQVAGIETVGDIPAGENSRSTYYYQITAIDAETGGESLPTQTVAIENAAPLSQTYHIKISIEPVAGASEYRVYKKSAGVFGYIGRVTEASKAEDGSQAASLAADDSGPCALATGESGAAPVAEALVYVFEDRNIEPDTSDTPPNARNPFAAEGEYPAIVFLHQQRLGYAASNRRPLTVWMSEAGNYESMAASIPPDDDDAIEATLAAPQANRILWAQSDRSGLALGTEGSEWLLTASDGSAISPRDLSFQPQTCHGSQPGLPVLRAGSSLLFMQRGGTVARDFAYSFQDDRYNTSDLSLLARHILRHNPVRAWCWQPEPYGIVWCALADGKMAALTYLREHDVVGWHRHETEGQVEDLACIPASGGAWQLWALVIRNGSRRVETLAPFAEELPAAQTEQNHLDGLEQVPFKARCIPCMPETQLQTGQTFARVRKINSIKARVINSEPFTARILAQHHQPTPQVDVPPRGASFATQADWNCPLAGGWAECPKLELILDGPKPATILGLLIAVEIAPLAGGQK